MLAGDSLKAAADLGLPVVGVSLLYGQGYFKQFLNDGWQVEEYPSWDPSGAGLHLMSETVKVQIEDREVTVGAFRYDIIGNGGHIVPVFFLDTQRGENAWWDKDITRQPLYTGHEYYRLAQQTVLGVGAVRMLQQLGFDIDTYHLNEGHAALSSLELLKQRGSLDDVISSMVFTTHTPVPAGLQKFPYSLAQQVARSHLPNSIEGLAGSDSLDMTALALHTSRFANGVSRRHGEVSRELFKGHDIGYITNGVHSSTWTSPAFQRIFDTYLPGWMSDPSLLSQVDLIDDGLIYNAHSKAKEALIEHVAKQTGVRLDPSRKIIGFARRMTPYKRAGLPFVDMEKLAQIAKDEGLQFVYAGKAHPHDGMGKEIIQAVYRHLYDLNQRGIPSAYIPNYGIKDAQLMVAGSAAWLNLPEIPLEASGTSGMCAAHNGVPQIGTLDGWWPEGHVEDRTGWVVGGHESDYFRDAQSLYEVLKRVAPVLEDPKIMKFTIGENAGRFSTHRMMKQYADLAYGRVA